MTSVVLAVVAAMVATSIGSANAQNTSIGSANAQNRSKAGRICVVAYNDKNRNRAQGSGEPSLRGWRFTITDAASGKAVGRLTSAAGKNVCIRTSGPGRFAVSQVTQPGWTPTTPRLGTVTVAVAAGETQRVTFGNRYSSRMASVCVVTYSDTNYNGQQNTGEPALVGRLVTVKVKATGLTVSTRTTVSGNTCANVLPGNYTVGVSTPSGWVPTLPTTSRQDVIAAVGVPQVLKFGAHLTGGGVLPVAEGEDKFTAACNETDTEAPAGEVGQDGEVDSNNGPIAALYPSQDTSLDTWYENDFGCDWSIGGEVPAAALDAGVDDSLKDLAPGTSVRDLITDLGKVEGEILTMAMARPEVPLDLPPVVYCEPAKDSRTCQYTPPANPPPLPGGNQAFGGRDIIFVHGFELDPILAKMSVPPNLGASSRWPGNQTEFTASTGYWKQKADAYWKQHITKNLGSVTSPSNRYLTIAWPSTQWLIYGSHAFLTQTARAMNDGSGVVPKSSGGDKSGFCALGCVIVSHSTGAPLVDVAMTIANNTTLFGDLKFIPDHMRAHVAFAGAFAGSGFATPLVALGLATVHVGTLCQIGISIVNLLGGSLSGCTQFSVVLESVLVDLVPPVMTTLWGPVIGLTPVPTLTVAGGHPSARPVFKWLLHRGFDDGVLTMNSTCANPTTATLLKSVFPDNIGWPSGYVAKATVRDIAINTSLGLILPPAYPLTPVVIRAYDMSNAARGIGFYLDQVGDRYLAWFLNKTSPVNSMPYYVGAACTPWVAPTGMVQPVAILPSVALWLTTPETLPLRRYENHYSFLQSTGDHSGFERSSRCYLGYFAQSDACMTDDKLNNAEEVRVVTNPYVYARLPGCIGNGPECAPLLSAAVKTMVEEQVKGWPLCKKYKWCKRIWIWKRVFHRMINWQTKTQADYVYQYVLKY